MNAGRLGKLPAQFASAYSSSKLILGDSVGTVRVTAELALIQSVKVIGGGGVNDDYLSQDGVFASSVGLLSLCNKAEDHGQ